MNRAQHTSTGLTMMTVCLSVAAAGLIAQSDLSRISIRPALSNHETVVNGMAADLRDFRMCSEQARMLAEQTADFGVLGMMTTVEAIGIDTGHELRELIAGEEEIQLDAQRSGLLSAWF